MFYFLWRDIIFLISIKAGANRETNKRQPFQASRCAQKHSPV
nr:MAG TPA: hypothetical protein [Caudoviricetes sp.]DAV52373.1 MAG TPA: hypothetical protein [Caudoviricetes sp.]